MQKFFVFIPIFIVATSSWTPWTGPFICGLLVLPYPILHYIFFLFGTILTDQSVRLQLFVFLEIFIHVNTLWQSWHVNVTKYLNEGFWPLSNFRECCYDTTSVLRARSPISFWGLSEWCPRGVYVWRRQLHSSKWPSWAAMWCSCQDASQAVESPGRLQYSRFLLPVVDNVSANHWLFGKGSPTVLSSKWKLFDAHFYRFSRLCAPWDWPSPYPLWL